MDQYSSIGPQWINVAQHASRCDGYGLATSPPPSVSRYYWHGHNAALLAMQEAGHG
jgi:hypothetical protein